MKLRLSWYPWVPLIAGILCGISAVIFMQVYIERALAQTPATQASPRVDETRAVIVAKRTLSPGQRVEVEALSLRHVHTAGLAADVFSPEHLELLIGQMMKYPVHSGQPIQQLHLTTQNAEQRLAEVLDVGTRAFTISVSAEDSNAGLIHLGDRVDFYDLSDNPPRLLANAVDVIATGTQYGEAASTVSDGEWSSEAYRTLTFAIDTTQLSTFSQLHRQQQLGFWLRPTLDTELTNVSRQSRVQWIVGRQLNVFTAPEEAW